MNESYTFKTIVLRALSTFGWTALGYVIILIPVFVLAFLAAAVGGSGGY